MTRVLPKDILQIRCCVAWRRDGALLGCEDQFYAALQMVSRKTCRDAIRYKTVNIPCKVREFCNKGFAEFCVVSQYIAFLAGVDHGHLCGGNFKIFHGISIYGIYAQGAQ